MRLKLFAICLAVGALTGAASAQTVTIKIKTSADVGKSTVYHSTEAESSDQQLIDAAGKAVKDEKNDSGEEQIYTETTLGKTDNVTTKWKRAYEKATKTGNGKTAARSFEGKTIVFERKDGKVVVSAEGDAKIDPKDLEELQKKEAKSDQEQIEALLPKKAVKVGEKWTVDPKQIAKALDSGEAQPFNLDKSSGEGVLTKTYEKNGKQFGVIEVTMKLALADIPNVTFDAPQVMELKVTVDTCIDGSSTAGAINHAAKMTMKGTIEVDGQKISMNVKADSTGKTTISAEK